jgi:hypothetical protein
VSLVSILASLRAQVRVNATQPARRVLKSGLGVHARPDGSWLLWRVGVQPGDKELETIARDAKITGGFSVRTSNGAGSSSNVVYRLLTPLDDDPDLSSTDLCPRCRSRSLLEDNSGGGTYCPTCGEGTGDPLPLETLGSDAPATRSVTGLSPDVLEIDVDPVELVIDWEAVEVGVDLAAGPDETVALLIRRDLRPGTRLEDPETLGIGRLWHFMSAGHLWTVKLELGSQQNGDKRRVVRWAPLESRYGGFEGSEERWRDWFAKHGALSPLVVPERWRGGA